MNFRILYIYLMSFIYIYREYTAEDTRRNIFWNNENIQILGKKVKKWFFILLFSKNLKHRSKYRNMRDIMYIL